MIDTVMGLWVLVKLYLWDFEMLKRSFWDKHETRQQATIKPGYSKLNTSDIIIKNAKLA